MEEYRIIEVIQGTNSLFYIQEKITFLFVFTKWIYLREYVYGTSVKKRYTGEGLARKEIRKQIDYENRKYKIIEL